MSGVTKDDQIGRVEEDQHLGHQQQTPLQGGNPPFPGEDSDGDEEEAITEMHSLEGATWRDMRVGQESARELFQRVQPHHWPTIQAFSFGGGGSVSAGLGEGNSNSNNSADSGGNNGGVFSGPFWRSGGGELSARRAWLVLGGVAVAVFMAVALRGGGYDREGDKSPLAAGTPRHRADGEGTFPHPSPLRKRLQSVADAALAAGITLPMHTTFEVIRSSAVSGDGVEGHGGGEGMDFIVSVIPTEALEAKAAIAAPPSTAASQDPFDPRVLDPRMTVEDLPPGHSLVLNKFNTMRNHALIITKEFQSQEEALTVADFSAWYRVVEELPAVGFFNSAVEAGASQRHKHMQVIPDDALWDYRPAAPEAIPVDEPIARLVGSSRDLDRAWNVPEFDFQHSFVLLPTPKELRAATSAMEEGTEEGLMMAVYLRKRYVQLLEAVGFDTSALVTEAGGAGDGTPAVPVSSLPPYNAILTTRWLMVVPRSRREWGGIDVNGMGFLGALLVREKAFDGEGAGLESVRTPGALTVLEGVSFGTS